MVLLAHLGVHPVSGGVVTVLDGQTKLSAGAEDVRVAGDGIATDHGNLWNVKVHPFRENVPKKNLDNRALDEHYSFALSFKERVVAVDGL